MAVRSNLNKLAPIALAGACLAAPAYGQVTGKPSETEARIGYALEAAASSYTYKETVDGAEFMRLSGPRASVAGRIDRTSGNGVFVAGELRLSYGRLDYRSASGTLDGIPDHYYDLRALAGRNFRGAGSTFSPYLGYGFRRLTNDSDGEVTSLGFVGYRRVSGYHYVPVGADWKLDLGGQQFLSINAEYDYLIRGSQLSDFEEEPIKNTQNRGWGVRASVLYGSGKWSAGPYLDYWRVAESNVDCGFIVGCWVEPRNITTDAGVRVRYSFE